MSSAIRRGRQVCSAKWLQHLGAAHVRPQRLGYDDGPVLLLMGLEDRDDGAGHCAERAVEGRDRPRLAVEAPPGVEATGLEVGAVGGRGELAVLALRRDPRLAVELAL